MFRLWKKKKEEQVQTRPATEDDFTIMELTTFMPSQGKAYAEFKNKQELLDRFDPNAVVYSYDGLLIQEFGEVVLACKK